MMKHNLSNGVPWVCKVYCFNRKIDLCGLYINEESYLKIQITSLFLLRIIS